MIYIAQCYNLLLFLAIAPKIVHQPFPSYANISSMIMFKCSGKGYGLKQVTWHKYGSLRLPENAVASVTKSSNKITGFLRIYSIIGFYKGYYFCSISNSGGTVTSRNAYLNITGMFHLHKNSLAAKEGLTLFKLANAKKVLTSEGVPRIDCDGIG